MQLLNLVDHLSASNKEVSFYFSGVQERFSMIKKSAKFENDMLKIKEDMVQDILWFHTTGSFFFFRGWRDASVWAKDMLETAREKSLSPSVGSAKL